MKHSFPTRRSFDLDTVYLAIDEMTKRNENSAKECTDISHHMSSISEFCRELENSTDKINNLIMEMTANNKEIMSVASQTNLLALNASIRWDEHTSEVQSLMRHSYAGCFFKT